MHVIDLRSDTVTKPTDKMREAMNQAIVGDDVYGEDHTVIALETKIAKMFRKDAALFFPSGTMSNLTAALTWCNNRGSEIILGDKSHMFLYEQAGISQFGGISMRTLPNLKDGSIDIDSIQLAIRDLDIHEPETKLICIENTHNACGGKILPIPFLKNLKQLSEERNIPIHMDGARLWNALTALNIKPRKISKYVDSLTVCLSKGLGCPVGSLLIGSTEFIAKARRIRKGLGGGMRQSGVLAACGLIALYDFKCGILEKDHDNTKFLAKQINKLSAFKVQDNVQTNIIFIDILQYNNKWLESTVSSRISAMLNEKGVMVSAWAPLLLRVVIHRNITEDDIKTTIDAFKEVSHYLTSEKLII